MATGRRRAGLNPLNAIADLVVPGVVDAVDIDEVVARVDVDALLNRVDIDALVGRIDINAVLERADINALLDRVDIDALVSRVDADALVSRVDADALVDRVDVNKLLHRADIDALLSRIDVDALVARIDADALLARVDVEQLIERIDLDRVISRVDVDRIVDRIDVARVVQRADLAGIVADSTRGITASTIDLVRRQLVGLDVIVTRVAARLVRRDPAHDPVAPEALASLAAEPPVPTPTRRPQGPSVSGRYAGPASRAAAMAVDVSTMLFLFGIAAAITSWTIDRLFGATLSTGSLDGWPAAVLFVTWAYLWFAVPLAMTGRTLGKTVVGLRVVSRDGSPIASYQAAVRVLVLPLSWMLLGLGLIGGVFGRERRTLHDVAARTTEVIDWGDRPAALPSPLARWIDTHRPADRPPLGEG